MVTRSAVGNNQYSVPHAFVTTTPQNPEGTPTAGATFWFYRDVHTKVVLLDGCSEVTRLVGNYDLY